MDNIKWERDYFKYINELNGYWSDYTEEEREELGWFDVTPKKMLKSVMDFDAAVEVEKNKRNIMDLKEEEELWGSEITDKVFDYLSTQKMYVMKYEEEPCVALNDDLINENYREMMGFA